MDPALKQRLIGAAVLVALAVIFLPMLIGGPEPTAPRSEVSLDMPAPPERPLQTREIPLTLPGTTPPAPATAVDPDAVVTVDADSMRRADARPEQADVPAAAVARPPAPPAATAPAPTPTTAPAAPAPGATAAAPAPAAASAAAPAGTRFVVNLGSYGNPANAEALRTRLRQAGLAVYGEPIDLDGKPATRLRAGPYATRAEAEAARSRARREQADLPAAVVVLDGGPAATTAARTPVAAGFAVQVGALKSEREADALAGRLRAAGFSAYVERVVTDGGPLWRVRAGPELQRDRAEKLRDEIRARLQLDGMVVGHP